MKLPAFLRRTHKWLALVVGLQVVFWTLSGLYMTAVHIDVIHGDHLVRPQPDTAFDLATLVEPAAVRAGYGDLRTLRLQTLLERPVYVVETGSGTVLVDARSGRRLPPVSEETVRAVARARYAGRGDIVDVRLLQTTPMEVQSRPAPLWRVQFEGWNKPTFYISPHSGELLARRHELWRVFDFVWMFHIMDYEARSDVNNPLLRTATVLAVLMSVSGLWLLVYSFPRRRRRKASAPKAA